MPCLCIFIIFTIHCIISRFYKTDFGDTCIYPKKTIKLVKNKIIL